MQEVCIDANIAIKWVVPGERWRQKARFLLRDAAAAGTTLIAPPLFAYETESVIQFFVYSGSMLTTQADSALRQIADAEVQILSVPNMVLRAREIARRYDQERIYDAIVRRPCGTARL